LWRQARPAEAVLLDRSGSNWSACVIDAVFVDVLAETTVATIESVCGVVVVTVPTSHTPLRLL
jgi:hypothetical protein